MVLTCKAWSRLVCEASRIIHRRQQRQTILETNLHHTHTHQQLSANTPYAKDSRVQHSQMTCRTALDAHSTNTWSLSVYVSLSATCRL